MEKAKLVLESYNYAVQKVFEELIESGRGDEVLKQGEAKVDMLIDRELQTWETAPIHDIDGRTPKEFFGQMDNMQYASEVFKLAAILCDRDIPRLLLDVLKDYGEAGEKELLKLAEEFKLVTEEPHNVISLMAVRSLGRLQAERAVEPLLDLLYSLDESQEPLVEAINDALVDIGSSVMETLVNRINGLEKVGYLDEYVINALVRVGKNHRQDEVFRCLKGAFGKMEDKLLGALCLGDYGDGRAIPALRGYIDKNRGSIDKATFLEMAAAIKKLGGNIDDLVKGTAF